MKSLKSKDCSLCSDQHYPIIWSNDYLRILLVNDQNYPGYCRVDLINHIKEMSDLDEKIRYKLMVKIFQIEKAIKQYLNPDKINLASLGNITPHIHWHIIPRYFEDNHFPDSIWSEKKRNITNEFSKEEENKFIENIKYNLNN